MSGITLCSPSETLEERLAAFDLWFDETLPVFEDWDLLMRTAMLVGVTSIPDATSLYRRLDHGNADTAVAERIDPVRTTGRVRATVRWRK